jgi:hypothetical protein
MKVARERNREIPAPKLNIPQKSIDETEPCALSMCYF